MLEGWNNETVLHENRSYFPGERKCVVFALQHGGSDVTWNALFQHMVIIHAVSFLPLDSLQRGCLLSEPSCRALEDTWKTLCHRAGRHCHQLFSQRKERKKFLLQLFHMEHTLGYLNVRSHYNKNIYYLNHEISSWQRKLLLEECVQNFKWKVLLKVKKERFSGSFTQSHTSFSSGGTSTKRV